MYNTGNVVNATELIHLKMTKMVNFMLYTCYHNFKKNPSCVPIMYQALFLVVEIQQ